MANENWVAVAAATELAPGEMIAVNAAGREIALYNVDGQYYATANVCTHAFALLTEGWFEDGVVECPLHAGRFDVRTGRGLGPPISCDLDTYAVRVAGETIEIALP